MVDFSRVENRKLIAYLLARSPEGRAPEQDPERTRDAYTTLGTHSDIVGRLWDDFSAQMTRDCRWILYGSPVLVHPDTGVVFGWAGGTVYALRLPPHEHAAAIRAGAETVHHFPAHPELHIDASTLDLAAFGPEWVFGGWFEGEELWCMAAYNEAGRTPIIPDP
jgi:hypothetical protein